MIAVRIVKEETVRSTSGKALTLGNLLANIPTSVILILYNYRRIEIQVVFHNNLQCDTIVLSTKTL